MQSLSDTLDGAGVKAKFHTYRGVQHAFLNEARPEVFEANTAFEVWRDIDSFLAAELS